MDTIVYIRETRSFAKAKPGFWSRTGKSIGSKVTTGRTIGRSVVTGIAGRWLGKKAGQTVAEIRGFEKGSAEYNRMTQMGKGIGTAAGVGAGIAKDPRVKDAASRKAMEMKIKGQSMTKSTQNLKPMDMQTRNKLNEEYMKLRRSGVNVPRNDFFKSKGYK